MPEVAVLADEGRDIGGIYMAQRADAVLTALTEFDLTRQEWGVPKTSCQPKNAQAVLPDLPDLPVIEDRLPDLPDLPVR